MNDWKVGAVAVGTFSLHLLANFVGSDWPIFPLYPVSPVIASQAGILSRDGMYNVVDPVAAAFAFAAVGAILYLREESPLEFVSKRLDRWVVGRLVFQIKHRCARCHRRSLAPRGACGRGVCGHHLQGFARTRRLPCAGRTATG